MELDQKRSIRSCHASVWSTLYFGVSSYPVVDLAVSNGVVDAIAGPGGGGQSFVSNEEVQVLSTTLPRQMAAGACAAGQEGRLVRNGRTA